MTDQLTDQQRQAIRLLRAGRSQASTARVLNVHPSVLSKWKRRSPAFREAVEAIADDLRKHEEPDTDDPHEQARRTLLRIAGDPGAAPSARVAAAKALTDLHPEAQLESREMTEHEAVQDIIDSLMTAARMGARGNLPDGAIDALMHAVAEASAVLLQGLAHTYDREAAEAEAQARMATAFASRHRR